MPEVYLKQGDTLPPLEATLKFEDGTVMDLTGCTVKFHMIDKDGSLKVDADATIVNSPGTDGKVRYDWVYNEQKDTDTPGRFKGEFEVTRLDGKIQTWPTLEPLHIIILEEYG